MIFSVPGREIPTTTGVETAVMTVAMTGVEAAVEVERPLWTGGPFELPGEAGGPASSVRLALKLRPVLRRWDARAPTRGSFRPPATRDPNGFTVGV